MDCALMNKIGKEIYWFSKCLIPIQCNDEKILEKDFCIIVGNACGNQYMVQCNAKLCCKSKRNNL